LDGSTVFVTGDAEYVPGDYATVAYDAATGTRRWSARYNGLGNGGDYAADLGVSADDSMVFVTGGAYEGSSNTDYATVAYDANTGDQIWVATHNGSANGVDRATALGVSPDGTTVFVTGYDTGLSGSLLTTLAYDALTGEELWATSYDQPGSYQDVATALGVSPDGSTVFVTGYSRKVVGNYLTIAYDAATGDPRWGRRYDGPAHGDDQATALGLSPGGSTVFVTGYSEGAASDLDFATVAYDASSGDRLWVRRNGVANRDDNPSSIGVSPDGSAVFVGGTSIASDLTGDYFIVAYHAATGDPLWARRGDPTLSALGVSPDGSTVFVTGLTSFGPGSDFATAVFDAATGDLLWARRRDGQNWYDTATALGVSPDGSKLFVTGESDTFDDENDVYLTVAYSIR
jgi:hypothetical protein